MKKENPEDNKIRRKPAGQSSKSSNRRPSSNNSDLMLPSERSKSNAAQIEEKVRPAHQIPEGLLPLVILRQKPGL